MHDVLMYSGFLCCAVNGPGITFETMQYDKGVSSLLWPDVGGVYMAAQYSAHRSNKQHILDNIIIGIQFGFAKISMYHICQNTQQQCCETCHRKDQTVHLHLHKQ